MEELHFQAFFNERIKDRGYTLEKLSKASGIAMKHLENLSAGNLANLPASPYFRGYLIKLGEILDFDGEGWWQKLKKESVIQTSGKHDMLPRNRFAPKTRHFGRWIGGGIIVLAFLLYIGLRFTSILGEPLLTISQPSQDFISVTASDFTLSGRTRNTDSLAINNTQVPLNSDGSWEKKITLQPGPNTIDIVAKKFLGREVRRSLQIIYQEGQPQ